MRAHRSHRWGRWFESNCHHHSAALENQGLQFFYPLSITAEGFTFFRVHFGDVNGSDNPNCQNCRLAQLPELSGWLHWWNHGKRASPKCYSGYVLNPINFRFSGLTPCQQGKGTYVASNQLAKLRSKSQARKSNG